MKLTSTEHNTVARLLRARAHDEDLAGHLAEERGDNIAAADHLDLRELYHRAAEYHEAESLAVPAVPGDLADCRIHLPDPLLFP
jgi:hypothetical protein